MLAFPDLQRLLPAGDNAQALTLSGSDVTLSQPSWVWVGGAGNVKVDTVGGQTAVVFTSFPAGYVLPVRVTKVYSSSDGTSATNLVAFW